MQLYLAYSNSFFTQTIRDWNTLETDPYFLPLRFPVLEVWHTQTPCVCPLYEVAQTTEDEDIYMLACLCDTSHIISRREKK